MYAVKTCSDSSTAKHLVHVIGVNVTGLWNDLKGLLSRLQFFFIYERKNLLKIICVDIFVLSFSSANFEFPQYAYFIGKFFVPYVWRHTWRCQSENEARMRESPWSIIKSHYKQINDHNRIKNCTMVYREAIGYETMWEEFSWILQGYGAEESMDNILQTQHS